MMPGRGPSACSQQASGKGRHSITRENWVIELKSGLKPPGERRPLESHEKRRDRVRGSPAKTPEERKTRSGSTNLEPKKGHRRKRKEEPPAQGV